ncbi:MAG TPA: alpha-2-macroglobulin family protein [Vicinamibacteria bacterium]|nr:alpha-2-macroglobulin family protein [Vicinamibacteria bacterium]
MTRSGTLILGVLASSLTVGSAAVHRPAAPATLQKPALVASETPGPGFRLSEGTEEAAEARTAVAPATLLDAQDTQKVLDRLPPLTEEAGEAVEFALREKSLPPPRTGRTVREAFPPLSTAPSPDPAEAGPLRVLRRAPEGEVPLAPHLSLTFSQPMVAVTSQGEAEKVRPVRLSPEPLGQWRWLGTKTLLFEPRDRFPMATDYQVEVPAGTRSATLGALGKAETWTFSTPAPTLVRSHPVGGPVRRDVLLFASFDQKIDPPAVLATLRLRVGGAVLRSRLATAAEVDADPTVRRLAADAGAGRFVAFRTEGTLPVDAQVTVAVGPGTPSAEGPKVTTKPQEWAFRTYGRFRVTDHQCGWQKNCPPFAPWQITLSNPIDAKAFRKEMVRVEPELPGLKVELYGQSMIIRGQGKGLRAYRLTLDPSLPDQFGQVLETAETLAFQLTAATPSLSAAGNGFVVLDPAAGPRFSVYSVNQEALSVAAYAVSPADWPAFQKYMQSSWRDDRPPAPPGRAVLSTTVKVEGGADELVETSLDLASALPGGLGQLVLIVEPTKPVKGPGRGSVVRTWIQATRLGLDAFADDRELLGWASSLADGKPLPGVDLSLLPSGPSAVTAENGLASLPLGAGGGALLVGRKGKDLAILPENTSWWGMESGWRRSQADALRFFVFDDRQMYRPGEEVKVKGWIRLVGPGPEGDVGALGSAVRTVSYVLHDRQGNEVARGKESLSAFGGFALTLKLPPTMNLGAADLALEADAGSRPGGPHHHAFQVQEFRRPEFEVAAAASEGPHVVGAHATVTVSASYYAGGGLGNANVSWRVASSPGAFVPPNRDSFAFGSWVPWWEAGPRGGETPRLEILAGRTDAGGKHRLRIDFERAAPPRPVSLRAEATVMDVNRQAWTSGVNLLVHPAELYVGLKSDRTFVAGGEPLLVDAIVTDLEGGAVAGRQVLVRAERLEWEQEGGDWKEKPVDPQDCRVVSGPEAVRCTFRTKEGGPYRITAAVADDKGRKNESQLRLWVAGGPMPPRREVEQESITLVPDRKAYRAGDTARILVLAPFSPAEGLLTLRRSGILRRERFTLTGSSHTLEIKLEEAWTPNVHVQVDLLGAAPRPGAVGSRAKPAPRPAFAVGHLNLPVPPLERTLALEVKPREKALPPGGETILDVALHDAAGRPAAGAEVAVVVVDEAVLSLTGYRLPDPLQVFYASREEGVRDHHSRTSVLLARPEDVMPQREMLQTAEFVAAGAPMPAATPAPQAPRLAGAVPERKEAAAPIRMRTDFSALALFAPSVVTDASGRAQVPLRVPDSLTRYRVMGVAVAGGRQFGSGESTLTARLPLMVRPSPPRFLNFGDRFELPVLVQNQTDTPVTVDVAVRALNADLPAGAGRRLIVAANDRAEIRFPAAARRAGTARFQVGAAAGPWADAAEFKLPVWTPATTEAFATYGQIDQGAMAQPVRAPAGVLPQFGGLEVTTSSTALQALTDAVLYLVAYPFECAEQLSSRVLAVAALRDVLTAFQAQGLPPPEQIGAGVKRDLERLRALQNDDGGFAFWRRGDEPWPYVSIHVAHALARAREKGFEVPGEMLERSRRYLKGVEGHIPRRYGEEARRTLIAYALYVRHRLGDDDAPRAQRLLREAGLGNLSFEAVGWLLPVLSADPGAKAEVAAIRTHLANRVTETAAEAHFAVSYGDGAHLLLYSDRRVDAILLEALIADQPKSDLIPKLVEGLLGHRRAGRWENTQENAFVLLALDRYFNTYEKATPDFVARAWLGERYAGEQSFKGRTTERHHLEVPMQVLAEATGPENLVLDKEGPGRLYYRIGLQYAPADLRLPPAERGFTVERAYEGADDKTDVRRDPDGTWRLRAGARVRVRLTMVSSARRFHVALVDPLPAGLEALNPALATTGTLPPGPPEEVTVLGAPGLGGPGRPGMWWFWTRPWFDHQNLRDERVEAFASLLWEGVYSYSYLARATTPGAFVVPPSKAEEMYHPETFGRSGTDRVVVE